MSARKQRSDATLKTLPEVVQEQLFALLRTESYANVRVAVREKWDVETSAAALSEFFRWYPTTRRLEAAQSTADQVEKTLRTLGDVNLDDAKIQKAVQAVFEAEALRKGDSETYIGLANIRLKREAGARDDRRIKLLEKRAALADQAEGIVGDKELTEAEKAQRLRGLFGMG
ncbi:MAG TPA: hypothetical protein VK961_15195 [Chthoniobacter sp.]|nr:hypothetical protein [Chthoniobacter sp.]